MKASNELVTIKAQVTIRKDMWERVARYMDGGRPSKILHEALRRFWFELEEKEQKEIGQRKVVEIFFPVCQAAYDDWQTHRVLFDDKSDLHKLSDFSHERRALSRISEITQGNWIQKIANLHDNAVVSGRRTLSLQCIINLPNWDIPTKNEMLSLKGKLDSLNGAIRAARNRILCHNDLDTYLTLNDSDTLGNFPEGLDAEYFEVLEQFLKLVSEKTLGVSFYWKTHAVLEAQELVSAIAKT